MSKWGEEEKETLAAIRREKLSGRILNLAAGDGRFNLALLEQASKVVAFDIDPNELRALQENCPPELKGKLEIKIGYIRNLPFSDKEFDGIFCTGTLHLFPINELEQILEEIARVLKPNGKMIFDFATDIVRYDKSGNRICFEDEGNYHTEEAKAMLGKMLGQNISSLNFEVGKFKEDNLDEAAGYQYIEGEFLLVTGEKVREKDFER